MKSNFSLRWHIPIALLNAKNISVGQHNIYPLRTRLHVFPGHSHMKLARHVLSSGKVICCMFQCPNNVKQVNYHTGTVKTNNKDKTSHN